MQNDLQILIQQIIEKAPVWVRHDLQAKDAVVRQRAEETLAAMIANAIKPAESPSHPV